MVTKRHVTAPMVSRARNAMPRPLLKGVMPIRGEAECGAGHNAHLGTCAAVAVGDRFGMASTPAGSAQLASPAWCYRCGSRNGCRTW